MTFRIMAAIGAAGLLLAVASAQDRKKTATAPATEIPPPILAASYEAPAPLAVATTIKSYSVGDLVIPMPAAGEAQQYVQAPKTLEAELIKKITVAVSPMTWKGNGGQGTIEYFPIGMALVVKNSPSVHSAIEKYLDALRRMQDQQVVTEMCVITMSDDWFRKCELNSKFCEASKSNPNPKKVVVVGSEDIDVMLRRAKEESAINVLSAPRVVTLNGQPAALKAGQTEHYVTELKTTVVRGNMIFVPKNEPHFLGIDFKIAPTVSACGKYVKLALNGASTELGVLPVPMHPLTVPIQATDEDGKKVDKPFTQFIQEPRVITRSVGENVVLPDGGSVMIYGGKATIEKVNKEQKSSEANHLIVVATCRVVKPEAGDQECEKCCATTNSKLAALMTEYAKACKAGKSDDARRLAMECLVIDPTCFAKK